jgi:tetratricopeptide (TPR) repeat protein
MKSSIWILALTFLLAACGDGEQQQDPVAFAKQQQREQMLSDISNLENQMNSKPDTLDKALANKMVDAYLKFYNTNSTDTISAEMLWKAANISTALGRHQKAIDMLINYHDGFKTAPKRADATYLVGFIYDSGLHNVAMARKYYEKTIELYPNSFWSEQAKGALAIVDLQGDDLAKFLDSNSK